MIALPVLCASDKPVLTDSDARRLGAVLAMRASRTSSHASTLQRLVDDAFVVKAADAPVDLITMNSCVVCHTDSGARVEVQLVYPWDADLGLGRISVLSELGMAMLGRRVGARIPAARGAGARPRWGVSQLLYQPEEAGDMHR